MKVLVHTLARPHLDEFSSWASMHGIPLENWDLSSSPPPDPFILISSASVIVELNLMTRFPQLMSVFSLRPEHMKSDLDRLRSFFEPALHDSSHELNQAEGELKRYSLDQSPQADRVIQDVTEYAQSQEVFEHLPEIIRTIASELLTNAFYNAPVDSEGKPLHSDRTKLVKLASHKKVDVIYGDDGKHIWMTVRDRYGSFSRLGLLRNLSRCAQYEKLMVRKTGGGAGIGLFMVYSWAAQMVFHFVPGSQTLVHVKVLKTKRNKVFDSQKVNLEIIETPNTARKVA